MKLLLANQATASRRRVYFFVVDATDGITAELGEAGGQPQISTDGGAWTDTGIGVLVAVGSGHYYAELTQAAVATTGWFISTRYKSAATAEAQGTTVQVVAFDPDNAEDLGLSALANIVATGAAVNQNAESFTATTVTVASGTYTDTVARNAVYHQLQDVAGTLDCYYQFDVGSDGVPTGVSFYGRVNSGNDLVRVSVWNWLTLAWVQVGSIQGTNAATDSLFTFPLFTSMVGTGANTGKVRVRLHNTGLTTSNTYVDQLFVSYAVVRRTVGYANGQIWIDTLTGTAGTVAFTNGTADNPALTLADALVLSAATGIKHFHVANGSTLTLVSDSTGLSFFGQSWYLALGGQIISATYFEGAIVSGIGTDGGTPPQFGVCDIGVVTIPPSDLHSCSILGKITFGSVGDYFFDQCASHVAGTTAPDIDWGAGVGGTTLSIRHYSGGIQFSSMLAGDVATVEGVGSVVVNASCNNAALVVRGTMSLTNNGTSMTLTETARTVPSTVADAVLDEPGLDHLVVGSVGETLAITKGLMQCNYLLDNATYDENGDITTARVRVFQTKADTDAGTNPIATMTVASTMAGGLGVQLKVTRNP